jgi:hypothetical protein
MGTNEAKHASPDAAEPGNRPAQNDRLGTLRDFGNILQNRQLGCMVDDKLSCLLAVGAQAH